MKNNRKFLLVMLTGILVILAACGNASDESSTALDNNSQDNNATENGNDDSSNSDSTESVSNTSSTNTETNDSENKDTNEKANHVPTKEEDAPANNTAGLKEEYLKKLNDAKKDMEEMRKNPKDDTTFALKKVEGDRFDVWDGLLNEVYGVLEDQLPADEMDQLRKEQREWIDKRDHTAKEASLKYEGGTMEQLEYVTVENNLTEERCFELVEDYMK